MWSAKLYFAFFFGHFILILLQAQTFYAYILHGKATCKLAILTYCLFNNTKRGPLHSYHPHFPFHHHHDEMETLAFKSQYN